MGVFMVATPIEFTFVFIYVFHKIHRNYNLCIKIHSATLLNTEMNALGIVTVSQKSEVSVADSTYTAVDSVTLSPGTYIVEVSIEFLSDFFSPSGARILIFRPGTAASYDHTNSVSAPPSRYTTIARTFLLKVSQEETYNVTVYQNSGEEATVNSCCRYVRLANV